MFSSMLLFLNIGGQEMIFIFVIALFLFGGKKLPELARGLGKGIREFKDASETIKRDINDQINDFDKEVTKPTQKALTESSSTPVSDDATDTEESVGVNSEDDISHSDEYYQHNYDYKADDKDDAFTAAGSDEAEPESVVTNNTTEAVSDLDKSQSQTK